MASSHGFGAFALSSFILSFGSYSQTPIFSGLGPNPSADRLAMAGSGRDANDDGCTEIYLGDPDFDDNRGRVTMQSTCALVPLSILPSFEGAGENGLGDEVVSLRGPYSNGVGLSGDYELVATYRDPDSDIVGQAVFGYHLNNHFNVRVDFVPIEVWGLEAGHFEMAYSGERDFLLLAASSNTEAHVYVFDGGYNWFSGPEILLVLGPFSYAASTTRMKATMIGDVNGDGLSEIAVSEPGAAGNGRVRIFDGSVSASPGLPGEQIGPAITDQYSVTVGTNLTTLSESDLVSSDKMFAFVKRRNDYDVVQVRRAEAPDFPKVANIVVERENSVDRQPNISQLGDVDGDGVLDFAISARGSSRIVRGDFSDNPSFMTLSEIETDYDSYEIEKFVRGDFDGDGNENDYATSWPTNSFIGIVHSTYAYSGGTSLAFGDGGCHAGSGSAKAEASLAVVGSGFDIRLHNLNAAFSQGDSLTAVVYASPVTDPVDQLLSGVIQAEGCSVYLGQDGAPIVEIASQHLSIAAGQDEKWLNIDMNDSTGLVGSTVAVQVLLISELGTYAATNPILVEVTQ